jgi:hypothetical protein
MWSFLGFTCKVLSLPDHGAAMFSMHFSEFFMLRSQGCVLSRRNFCILNWGSAETAESLSCRVQRGQFPVLATQVSRLKGTIDTKEVHSPAGLNFRHIVLRVVIEGRDSPLDCSEKLQSLVGTKTTGFCVVFSSSRLSGQGAEILGWVPPSGHAGKVRTLMDHWATGLRGCFSHLWPHRIWDWRRRVLPKITLRKADSA